MWCSVHPNENIQITFYSERAPIPVETVNNVLDNNRLGGEDYSKRAAKADYVRELEVTVVLSKYVATLLNGWLTGYLEGKPQPDSPPPILPH